uniref:Uncharacterized protein n=1 Tax=Anguilla anguilla TaxID=7936 RepID=A0A0E9XBI5_ANGAN
MEKCQLNEYTKRSTKRLSLKEKEHHKIECFLKTKNKRKTKHIEKLLITCFES